ncbi:MAG: sugar transferase [Myxococcota bacterium]
MRYYIRHPLRRYGYLTAGLDFFAAFLAIGFASYLSGGRVGLAAALPVAVLATGLIAMLFYSSLYRLDRLVVRRRAVLRLAISLALGLFALRWAFPAGALGLPAFTPVAIGLASLLLVGLSTAARTYLSFQWNRDDARERVLVLGTNALARAIGAEFEHMKDLGLDIAGYVSDDPEDTLEVIAGSPVFMGSEGVEKYLIDHDIRRVIVTDPTLLSLTVCSALVTAKLAHVLVEDGLEFWEAMSGRIFLRGLPAARLVSDPGFTSSVVADGVRRGFDVLVASVGLVLSAPIVALAALAIRLDSEGPVLFKQERVGRGGHRFQICKLRTMRSDAEAESGAVWTSTHDDRITPVGGFLRKSRIDELPQLWNVLVGDMGIVGPRPERPEFADQLAERYPHFAMRTAIRPGITGWAQVRMGYVNDMDSWEHKLSYDLYYLKRRTLSLDVLILFRTTQTLVALRGL